MNRNETPRHSIIGVIRGVPLRERLSHYPPPTTPYNTHSFDNGIVRRDPSISIAGAGGPLGLPLYYGGGHGG